MSISLNRMVKPQSDLLNQNGIRFSNTKSATKRLYVEGKKPQITVKDLQYMLKHFRSIYKLPSTLFQTTRLIKHDVKEGKRNLDQHEYQKLKELIETLGIKEFGFFEVTSDQIFKGYGVPHKYALVLSIPMNPERFQSAPSIECQLEVARVYAKTGDAANQVANLLQGMGFGASPNHSMGGQLDYSMACEWAGIGVIGRHSMAITPKSGACHRISLVYVSIENLEQYIQVDRHELQWVKSFCDKCGKCIRKCPTHAILEKPVALDGACPTKIDYEKCCEGFTKYGCGVCIKECPFTTSGYDKIKDTLQR